MDEALTLGTIREAQAGDERAAGTIWDALTGRLMGIAVAEARKMTDVSYYTEEYFQAAQIAVWTSLARFEGDSVDEFYAFAYRTAQTSVLDLARTTRWPGADPDAMKAFTYWVRQAEGDAYLAEKLAQRLPDPITKHRLGRDRANAARLAYQGTISENSKPNADQLGGLGSYEPDTTVDFSHYLLSTIGLPEDLITPDDVTDAELRATVETVRAVLDSMSEQPANVLRATYGIEPLMYFGNDDNEALGALLGITGNYVGVLRSRGKAQFAERWIKVISHGDATIAQAWRDAFEAQRQSANASATNRKAKAAAGV